MAPGPAQETWALSRTCGCSYSQWPGQGFRFTDVEGCQAQRSLVQGPAEGLLVH
ncbi:MAG: hypothetical protein Ct9H300mP31_19040 [Acidimicrobiaceae bacterium]|nr:MAG: hypothetical protein Ct9H300mP31_19040 [Acidimicrobiaceae bacterium]